MDATDLFTLARTIWGEARGEPFSGKVAVGWVVRNRRSSGKWYGSGSIADICRRPWQFSCWNDADSNRGKLETLTLNDPQFLEAVYVAAGVLGGHLDDPTGGATHYYNPRAVRRVPPWADGRQVCARIGHHLFHREIN